MEPSLCPSSVAVASIAAYEHQSPSSTDDDEEEDEFEFRPLLVPQLRRNARTERARHARRVACTATQLARRAPSVAAAAKAEQAPTPPPRRVRWHHMAFGSVRVPSAMDMGEIRRRLKARQVLAGSGNDPSSDAAAWAPWRLIRSLSCKGVEAVAVAAAAAPVRLV